MTNNFDDILQQVVDTLANKQRDGGLNAANLLTKFWGKQLLPSDVFNKAKTESKESNDPRKRNQWLLFHNAEHDIRKELANQSTAAQEIVIEDDHKLEPLTSTKSGNFEIIPFIREHVDGKHALIKNLTKKYADLDYTTYSVSLLNALREVYQHYTAQVHAALAPVLNTDDPRHQQAKSYAKGDGWKLLRLIRHGSQETRRNEIVTSFNKMKSLEVKRAKMGGTTFLHTMELSLTQLLKDIQQHVDLEGKPLSAADFVTGMALAHAQYELHKLKYLEQVVQNSNTESSVFDPDAMLKLSVAVQAAENLAGESETDHPQEIAAAAAPPSHAYQQSERYRQDLHTIFEDTNAAQQLNENRGPGKPRQQHKPGIALYYDYKEYLQLTGAERADATAIARSWAQKHNLFPDKREHARSQQNSQTSNNKKTWKAHAKKTISAMLAKKFEEQAQRNKRNRDHHDSDEEDDDSGLRSPRKKSKGRTRRQNGPPPSEDEDEEMSTFTQDKNQRFLLQDKNQRSYY